MVLLWLAIVCLTSAPGDAARGNIFLVTQIVPPDGRLYIVRNLTSKPARPSQCRESVHIDEGGYVVLDAHAIETGACHGFLRCPPFSPTSLGCRSLVFRVTFRRFRAEYDVDVVAEVRTGGTCGVLRDPLLNLMHRALPCRATVLFVPSGTRALPKWRYKSR